MSGRSLKEEAESALASGEIERALEAYQQLEIAFHMEPSYSRQVASLHETLGNDRECIEALERAAQRCIARQEPIKAIAACKLLQAIDPENARARQLMGRLIGPPPPIAPILPVPNLISDLVLPLPRMRSERGALHLLHPGAQPRAIPLFSMLRPESLEALLRAARLFRAEKGRVMFRQGDRGDSLFVVIEGGVSVYLEDPRVPLAELGDGSFFGEISLLTDRARGATVECSSDTELLEISRDALLDAIREEPSATALLLSFLRERLVEIVVKTGPLFRYLETDEERTSLASRFALLDAGHEAVLIEQGQAARGLYVLVDGSVNVTRETEFDDVLVAVLGPGHLFGEISTITRLPAVAKVTAAEPSLLLFLDAAKLGEVIKEHPRLLVYATELAAARVSELEAIHLF
jgi:CRP-like cAMP-binding protein